MHGHIIALEARPVFRRMQHVPDSRGNAGPRPKLSRVRHRRSGVGGALPDVLRAAHPEAAARLYSSSTGLQALVAVFSSSIFLAKRCSAIRNGWRK